MDAGMTSTAEWPIDGHIRLPRGPRPPASAGPLRDLLRPVWQRAKDPYDVLGACRSLLMIGDLPAA
jgi:hypothetical protein